MSEEIKNPLIESFLKLHELVGGTYQDTLNPAERARRAQFSTPPARTAIPPRPAMDTAPQPQTGSDNVANVIKNAAANRSASALGGFGKIAPDAQGTSSFSGMPKTDLGATSPEGFIKRMSGVEKANPISSVGKLESGSLKVGSRGDDVKALQKRLGVDADGIFGPKTAEALKKMQQSAGLKADSVYGKQSASYLDRKDALSKLRSENPIGARKIELGADDKLDINSGTNAYRFGSAIRDARKSGISPGYSSLSGKAVSTNDADDRRERALRNNEEQKQFQNREKQELKFKQGIREDSTMTNKLIDSFLQLQAMKTDNIFEAAKKVKKLDPVGKEDEDIDNDGDKDKSDSYLHNRRKKIASAMKEAKDPHAEGMVKAGTKVPEMTPDPDYAKKKPAVQTPNRAEKSSLPKGVTVKANEEVEQIDEALSADHKAAIKAHIRGMWGKGEVAFGNQGGREFVSHSDGIQKHVHSIHMKKGVPHVTHFLSMDEEVGFSEAELEHISAILEGPAAPTPDDYSSKAFGATASRSGTLTDEAIAEAKGKGAGGGRPKGSKSGSKHGSGTGEGSEPKNLAAQIRHTRPSGGNFELKHPTTGETKSVPAKAATEFYNKYTGAEKPAQKQAHHDEFLAKHFGSKEKPKTGITLPSMPKPKS